MSRARYAGRDWKLYSSYRRARWGWKGFVYWNPDWVAIHLDGIGSRLAWSGYAFTERGVRRRMARALLREREKNERNSTWFRGHRRV